MEGNLRRLIPIKKLEPYFKIAAEEARKSECIRRQYAACIVYEDSFEWVVASNSRVSRCCNGNICARNRVGVDNGERVEVGAEIHAETAAIILSGGLKKKNSHFILVGFYHGKEELYGSNVYPCHTCALNIKFAGYSTIFIKESEDNIIPININKIIEYREEAWEPL